MNSYLGTYTPYWKPVNGVLQFQGYRLVPLHQGLAYADCPRRRGEPCESCDSGIGVGDWNGKLLPFPPTGQK